MPLIKSGSQKAVRKNTGTLIKEGKPVKQAFAISKSIQRKAKGQAPRKKKDNPGHTPKERKKRRSK